MMTQEEKVKSKWKDAEISTAFARQKDGGRKWMYCVMSYLKFASSRGNNRVLNIGSWKYSTEEAWADAARRLEESQ